MRSPHQTTADRSDRHQSHDIGSNAALSPQGRLLTVAELAEALSMHPVSVRRMVADGRLPVLRVGRALRFDWSSVINAMEQRGGHQ
jgi:excisionase family DNA binding protein